MQDTSTCKVTLVEHLAYSMEQQLAVTVLQPHSCLTLPAVGIHSKLSYIIALLFETAPPKALHMLFESEMRAL